MIFCSM